MRKVTPEARIKQSVIKILKFHGWFTEINVQQGWGCKNGRPDLEATRHGVTIRIECKSPKGRLSDDQVKYIANLREHGAVVFVTHNPEQFLLALEELQERLWPGKNLKRLC